MPEQNNIMLHGGNVWQGAGPAQWLDFSANLRPEGMPDWVRGILSSTISEAQYYPDTKQQAAVMGLAEYLGVSPACVLPFAGGLAAIDMVCRTARGRIIVEKITFGEYARRALACCLPVVVRKEDGRILPGDTLFLCNPNNPTGGAVQKSRALALYRSIHSARARMCVDEAFIDFCPALTLRHEATQQSDLIVIGSLTKTLCVPGIRLGYLIAAPETINTFKPLCVPWALNSLAVALARALPLHKEEIQRDTMRNTARREQLISSLVSLGAAVRPSQANFVLADFKRPMDQAVLNLQENGILVRTCASFGLKSSYLRFAVKTEEQNARLIAALKEALCAESV